MLNGKNVTEFSKKVPVLSIPNLKALLYSIRNLFDLDVLKSKVVNPSYLLSKAARKSWLPCEHQEWSLENEDVFYKFHKILLPFNS